MPLTERIAATAFARAWNRLDPDAFLDLLAPDARYASQWVFSELDSREAITDYLRGKMKTIRDRCIKSSMHRARAALTTCRDGRDCVAMTQGDHDEVIAVVVFTVSGNRIARYDMCMPALMGPLHSGVFPI